MLVVQSNLSNTYQKLGRLEEATQLSRDVYCARVKLSGKENNDTLVAASNYAADLFLLQRFEEARSLLRKVIPVARRFLGESDDATLRMRWVYARAVYEDPAAALKDLRKVVKTLEELAPTARQVFGGAHPLTTTFDKSLRDARAVLAARETPSDAS